MCEPGIKGHLIYSPQNQACAVRKLLHDYKNKNALHDQTFRWDKYIYKKKKKKKKKKTMPPPPLKLKNPLSQVSPKTGILSQKWNSGPE